MKKLLLLGGKPIGSCEIVEQAHSDNIYVIVADYLPIHESAAKQLADESWDISTSDIDGLVKLCKENCVDGVIASVHEFNIEMAIKLSEKLGLPSLCTLEQWDQCNDKSLFKKMCQDFDIPVSKEYSLNSIKSGDFPLICKPADSSGSRGFSICKNYDELSHGYEHALSFSEKKQVLIEQYMPYDAVIIHYTVVDGKVFFSGISDKESLQLNNGGKVMALQKFPGKHILSFLKSFHEKIEKMIISLGIRNGVLWFEAFDNDGFFSMNEMGLRFGGSLTYYPVQFYTNFNQLSFVIHAVLGEKIDNYPQNPTIKNQHYAIVPLHVKAGIINNIVGIDVIKKMPSIYAYVPVHFRGDKIQNWNSAQQVFCYLHILYHSQEELKATLFNVLNLLHVYDIEDNELLFCLYPINNL